MNTKWIEWVRSVTHSASARQIAHRTGTTHTTVSRWLAGEPPVGAAVAIAVAYHASIGDALIAAGIIDVADLEGMAYNLRRVPTADLMAELCRRGVEEAS